MNGNKAVNSTLNKILGAELIAINQYFLHARILKNWGFEALADETYKASIDAMKEADRLIERILFLEGLPNLQDLGKISIGQTVPEILTCDQSLENSFRALLLEATIFCEKNADFVSRELLTGILKKSEHRIDFHEIQLELITKLGLENYLQTAVKELEA